MKKITDMRAMIKYFVANGWYIHSQKNHYKWRHELYGQYTTAKTPSDNRAFMNNIKNIDKLKLAYEAKQPN